MAIPETNEFAVSISDAYERGRVDINFFAALAIPDTCVFKLPDFYVAVWQIIVEGNPEDPEELLRFCLGLPRGHAKTTFIKILITWLIVYDKISFALIVCANAELAENLLSDINDILSSTNIESVYGFWGAALATDSAETKIAAYHSRAVVLVARGWSAGVRGINLKNKRPDFIFCDDVQTRKNDESPTERANLLAELTGTIFKAIAPRGRRTIVYVGNMYSEDCILNQLRKNSSWISMITGAILANGIPLWAELHSLKELRESFNHDEQLGLAHVWFAEVMNDPKSILHSILPSPLPESNQEDLVMDDGAYVIIDPAGFRIDSDDNVIAGFKKFDSCGYAVAMNRKLKDPSEIVQEAIRMALDIGATLIAVESVGYQQTLGFWINFFMRQMGISHIKVVELQPHGRSKESRIRQYISELYKGTQYIHSLENRREFTWQASLYKIGKRNNKDDILDAHAYSLDIRNEFWHLITPLYSTSFTVNHDLCSVEHNSCF